MKEIISLLGFDSMTHYQFVHFANHAQPYPAVMDEVKREWKRIDETYDIPYFPHISVGWDNNSRFTDSAFPIMTETTPENIREGFLAALPANF